MFVFSKFSVRLVDTSAPFHLENMLKDVSKACCGSHQMPPTLTISRVFHCSSTIYSAEHSTVTTTLSRFCNCSLHNAQQTSFIPQLMIAPPLTGASMHYHYTAGTFAAFGCAKVYSSLRCVAANALVYGAKRWFLISPEQAMYATASCTPAFPPSLSLPNPCTWMRSFQPRYHARGCVRSNLATRYSSKHALAWVAEDVPVLRQQVPPARCSCLLCHH